MRERLRHMSRWRRNWLAASAALFTLAFVFGAFWFAVDIPWTAAWVSLDGGSVCFGYDEYYSTPRGGLNILFEKPWPWRWSRPWRAWRIVDGWRRWPSFRIRTANQTHIYQLPLWIPATVCAGTAFVRSGRCSEPDAHTCAMCHYDLRGLTSPSCPECGSPIIIPPERVEA